MQKKLCNHNFLRDSVPEDHAATFNSYDEGAM